MITYWHNPRCSKSRAGLALLRDAGAHPQIRLYLDDPPDLDTLTAVQAALGLPALAMMRPKEPEFMALGLGPTSDDATLLAAMAKFPRLIERPIALCGARAVIARPPEALLDLIAPSAG